MLNQHHAADDAQPSSAASTLDQPAPSQLPALPAGDGLALLEHLDGFSGVRNALRHISEMTADWAGIPMPIDGERLVIEPSFPMAAELAKIGAPPEEPDDPGVTLRNRWFSKRLRCDVYVYTDDDGKVRSAKWPRFNNLGRAMHTLGCSAAWGIEQESRAIQLLGRLVRHVQFKQYMLTGMFLETSKRSGLTYLFRKLRPTVAIDARAENGRTSTRILCALCMHPIAYYSDTWAGAMTPTDDVIAHLMLMRGDEPMLWRRANQHGPESPEAAI